MTALELFAEVKTAPTNSKSVDPEAHARECRSENPYLRAIRL